jgi:hypothetical protein
MRPPSQQSNNESRLKAEIERATETNARGTVNGLPKARKTPEQLIFEVADVSNERKGIERAGAMNYDKWKQIDSFSCMRIAYILIAPS